MTKRVLNRKNIYIIIVVVVALVCAAALILLCKDDGKYHGVSVPDVSSTSDITEPGVSADISRNESANISFDYSIPVYEHSGEESDISIPNDISDIPEISLPEVSVPEESKPEDSKPEDSKPEESAAEISETEESVSEESEAEISVPEVSETDVSETEVSRPETSSYEVSEPETSQSEESVPEESVPEESVPQTNVPETSAPEISEPETSVPEETSSPSVPATGTVVVFPDIQVPSVSSSTWNGSSANGFESGKGSKSDPYIIKTAAQLAYFRDSVNSGNNYAGKYIKLAESIKLNDGDLNKQNLSGKFNVWVGIGSTKTPFYGTFDGDGHIISGVYGDALFNTICGSVLNLGVTNSYINFCGGIIGTASKDYKSNAATVISDCYIVDSIVNGGGGVVDYAGGYDISDCYNGAYINASGDWAGGVIGQLAFGTATNCYNVGTVDGDTICGGVVGNSMRGTIKNCYNAGSVKSTLFAGAFAGTQQSSTFTNCGYLSGTAEYVYQTYSGEAVYSNDGIKKYTKSQIEY